MTVVLIAVFVGINVGLWPVFVRQGVRRGVERTYLYERISLMPACFIAALVVSPFVMPASAVLGTAVAAVFSFGLWCYVTVRSIPA